MAVISLDFESTATCPSVSRASLAQALTRCSGFRCRRLVAAAAQGLAIDGDVLADLAAQVFEPLLDAGHQLGRIEHGEHPAERVVRRNAAFELEEGPQPVEPIVAEPLYVGPAISPGNRAAQRHHHQLEQVVNACPLDPRIGQIFKRCKNCHQSLSHEKTSVSDVLRRNSCKAPCLFQPAINSEAKLDAIAVGRCGDRIVGYAGASHNLERLVVHGCGRHRYGSRTDTDPA